MIGEISLNGVYLSSALISAVIALAIAFVVRRLLSWAGAYRFVWHPALFDAALFVIAWAAVIRLPLPQVS
jgi:hypothetical protein